HLAAEWAGDPEILAVDCGEALEVARHHQPRVRLEVGAAGELEADAACELPAAEIDGVAARVPQLDELPALVLLVGVVEDLGDEDRRRREGMLRRGEE